jgi:DNA-directed RNA polymerase subunit M/transcription elongation factor TFIIS
MKQDKKRRNCVDCGGRLLQKMGKGRPLLRCPRCEAERHKAAERERYRRSGRAGTLAKARAAIVAAGPQRGPK